jgi:hypothetical protein
MSNFIQQNTQYFSDQEESKRYGMYKNYRVGVIKYYNKGKEGSQDSILVEVIESCNGASGSYFASYNLYLEVDKRFASNLDMSSVGKWVLIGFYIQSFRSQNAFDTSLKLRHYEEIESNDTVRVEIFDPRIREGDQMRSLIIPNIALKLMQEISDKTKFNEYGKR